MPRHTPRPVCSVEYLHDILIHYPDTGVLVWKPRPLTLFYRPLRTPAQIEDQWDRWNTDHAWRQANEIISASGYRVLPIKGRSISSARVGWAMHTGSWPVYQIDHINRVRHDDRITNLRDVTQAENLRNRAPYTIPKGSPPKKRKGSGKKYYWMYKPVVFIN